MMNINCERPYAFYFLLLLIPALIICIYRQKKIIREISFFSTKEKEFDSEKKISNHFSRLLISRLVLRSLSWIFLVFAFSGISWGTYLEPVGKTGTSVSLVFDISYSMMASDGQGGQTRLKSSAEYASILLSHIKNTSVSCVLAKGEGVNVIPLTEDKASVEGLLESLSPALVSVGGTSLGKGVLAALKTFPENTSSLSSIWLFTDGEETDGLLENAISECLKKGVSVCIIGFGREKETKVFAGDGKTQVSTALRSEKMRNVCSSAMKKTYTDAESPVRAEFVDSSESGSALKVLGFVNGYKKNPYDDEAEFITYEVLPVERYKLFMSLAILCFALSFIFTEMDSSSFSKRNKNVKKAISSISSSIIFLLLFNSCSSHFDGAKTILESTWSWYGRKYNRAIAGYLQVLLDSKDEGDKILEDIALYNLGSTYLVQNENEAANEKFYEISDSALERVKYSAFYNAGIISYNQGDYDLAVEYFRSALKIDGSKIDAKINLELSMQKSSKDANSNENEISPSSEQEKHDAMEDAVFRLIKENDAKQWENNETHENSLGSDDF